MAPLDQLGQATRRADQPIRQLLSRFMIPKSSLRVVGVISVDDGPSRQGGSQPGPCATDATLADLIGGLTGRTVEDAQPDSVTVAQSDSCRRATQRLENFAPPTWSHSRIPADLEALADELELIVEHTRRMVAALVDCAK